MAARAASTSTDLTADCMIFLPSRTLSLLRRGYRLRQARVNAYAHPPACGEGGVGVPDGGRASDRPPHLTPPRVMSKTCLRHEGEGNPVGASGGRTTSSVREAWLAALRGA